MDRFGVKLKRYLFFSVRTFGYKDKKKVLDYVGVNGRCWSECLKNCGGLGCKYITFFVVGLSLIR
jgi:hypothetical protein